MALRQFDFIVGPETSTLPSIGTPTGDDDLISLGFADARYTQGAEAEATITTLKAMAEAERRDGDLVLVKDTNNLYRFDSASAATGDDNFVLTPDAGTGRWIRVTLLNRANTFTDTTQSTSKDTGAMILEGGMGIEKNLYVGGNIDVTGDLSIQGTTTTVNTATLDVEDPNITVNNSGNQATANSAVAGFTVEMSDATDVRLGYDSSTTSRFKCGDSGSEIEVATISHTQTFSNKSMSGSSNTFTNIPADTALTNQVPIANGGTNGATATAGFDNLAPTTTKGDLITRNASNNVRLGVGTDGTVLTADSAQATGLTWTSPLTNPMDSQGDLIKGGGGGAAVKLDLGAANTVVKANAGGTDTEFGLIANANIDASAAIVFSKLESLTSGQIIVGSVGNVPTAVAMSGDMVISNTGVISFNGSPIVNADVNAAAAIDGTKISPNFGSQTVQTTGTLLVDNAATFNDSGASVDFRVESNTDANCLFVDGSADNVGVGTNTPGYKLEASGAGENILRLRNTSSAGTADIKINATDFTINHSANLSDDTFKIESSGNITLNENGDSVDFRVESNTDANCLIVDGSGDKVGVGIAVPVRKMHVQEAGTIPLRLTNSSAAGSIDFTVAATSFSVNHVSGGTNTWYGDSNGRSGFGTNDTAGTHSHFRSTGGIAIIQSTAGSSIYDSEIHRLRCDRAANTAYSFIGCYSDFTGTNDREFNFRGDGNGFCDGSFTGGGADYAEYFEWSDGNPNNEDRVGMLVCIDQDDKIKIAGEKDKAIGVISAIPSFIGNNPLNWSEKYLRDDFNRYVLDKEGNRKLNPKYDGTKEYKQRSERKEWGCVGLLGKLRIKKKQPAKIPTSWVKLRKISKDVQEYLVK